MNTGTEDRDKRPSAEAGAKGGDLGPNALLQQQLQQQQLQLLQLQQQQLASMTPSEIAAMTQQMALFMMPMMPFMMPLSQQLVAPAGSTDAAAAAPTAPTASATSAAAPAAAPAVTAAASTAASATPAFGASDAMGDAFSSQSSPLSLLGGAQLGSLAPSADEAPKRKRGRPPKRDVAARAKADAEKAIKQFPVWGYGLPMQLLPGFPGVVAGAAGAGKDDAAGVPAAQEDQKDSAIDTALDAGAVEVGKPPKKKSRGTGKPRGRPRTRPRPGEIIHRPKPPPIAPANYSVMYNYSLSNVAAKPSELGNDAGNVGSGSGASAQDDTRLASLGASLLSGDHE